MLNTMNIEFYRKNVYGNELMYIVDIKIQQAVKTLTGQKSLTPNVRGALEELGFTFTEVLAPLKS